MIEIKKLPRDAGYCNCCGSSKNVKNVVFVYSRYKDSGLMVCLCEKCRNELSDRLEEDRNADRR